MRPLGRRFFARPTPDVARELLGHHIVQRPPNGGSGLLLRIVETEAYVGPTDPGSHARLGRHTRAGRLWEEPGRAYVFVCYGIHHMLNVVAHRPGEVGGVLLRAAEVVEGGSSLGRRRPGIGRERLASGPGNLGRVLGLKASRDDGCDLTRPPLYLGHGRAVPDDQVIVTGRIGLTAGGELPLRFLVRASPSVSRPAQSTTAK